MHRLLLCWDKNPLRKLYWGLSDVWNSTCPNTNFWLPPMEVIQIPSPLIIGSCCIWYACCVQAWLLIFGGHSWAESRYTSSRICPWPSWLRPWITRHGRRSSLILPGGLPCLHLGPASGVPPGVCVCVCVCVCVRVCVCACVRVCVCVCVLCRLSPEFLD